MASDKEPWFEHRRFRSIQPRGRKGVTAMLVPLLALVAGSASEHALGGQSPVLGAMVLLATGVVILTSVVVIKSRSRLRT